MAFVHGRNTYIAVDDSGGTLRNLSTFCDSVSGLPGSRDLAETTSFGANGTQSIPGLENVSFSISGSFDPTATTGPIAVLNGLRTATTYGAFEFAPQGQTNGNILYSGNCWLSSFEVEASVDDKVSFEAEFQVEGTVSIGTVSI